MASPDITATVEGSENKISLKIESPPPGEQTTVVNDAKEEEANDRTETPTKEGDVDNAPDSVEAGNSPETTKEDNSNHGNSPETTKEDNSDHGNSPETTKEDNSDHGTNNDNVETEQTEDDNGGPNCEIEADDKTEENAGKIENEDRGPKLVETENTAVDTPSTASDNAEENAKNEPTETTEETANDTDSEKVTAVVSTEDTVGREENSTNVEDTRSETVEQHDSPQDGSAPDNGNEEEFTEIAIREERRESNSEQGQIVDVIQQVDGVAAEPEDELFLTNQEAEKQVMHELIDETVVLEKDIDNLEKKLHQVEAENVVLASTVQPLKETTETQQTKIKQLEEELKEAKMGDGDQRKALDSAQQKIKDLEYQLQRLVKDDNAKSQKLRKLEKDLHDSNEKVVRLEKENSAQNPSQPPKSGACVVM